MREKAGRCRASCFSGAHRGKVGVALTRARRFGPCVSTRSREGGEFLAQGSCLQHVEENPDSRKVQEIARDDQVTANGIEGHEVQPVGHRDGSKPQCRVSQVESDQLGALVMACDKMVVSFDALARQPRPLQQFIEQDAQGGARLAVYDTDRFRSQVGDGADPVGISCATISPSSKKEKPTTMAPESDRNFLASVTLESPTGESCR